MTPSEIAKIWNNSTGNTKLCPYAVATALKESNKGSKVDPKGDPTIVNASSQATGLWQVNNAPWIKSNAHYSSKYDQCFSNLKNASNNAIAANWILEQSGACPQPQAVSSPWPFCSPPITASNKSPQWTGSNYQQYLSNGVAACKSVSN
jgi:hypothetical protein